MLGERKSMAMVDEMLELASSGSFTTFSAAQTSRAMLACVRALRAGMDADTAGKEADAAGRPPLRLHPPMWRPCA